MEENKIVEGNKAIAKFMGWSFGASDIGHKGWFKPSLKDHGYLTAGCRTDKGLKFNRSWEQLMPVVEKIESLPHHDRPDFNYVVTIESGYCVITDNGEAPIAEAQWDGPKIDLVWHCVVAFINWKNSQHG